MMKTGFGIGPEPRRAGSRPQGMGVKASRGDMPIHRAGHAEASRGTCRPLATDFTTPRGRWGHAPESA